MCISINITKEVNSGATGGYVCIYTSFPHAVSITEARRFSRAMEDAITLATRWQEGNQFVTPREPPPPEVTPPPVVEFQRKAAAPQSAGGKARAAALTSERRREIASKAANTRWACATPK